MKVGDVTERSVISTGKYFDSKLSRMMTTKEVVIKTFIGKMKGKNKFSSNTVHTRE